MFKREWIVVSLCHAFLGTVKFLVGTVFYLTGRVCIGTRELLTKLATIITPQ